YLTSGHLAAYGATATSPAGGSSSLSGSVDKLAINLGWTSGPGDGRLVVMKEGSAVNGTPADLSKYSPDAVFKNGSQIATGEYVVYGGSGNTVTITGLEPGKVYHYTIFEYNGVDAPVYNTANTISGSTIVPGALPLKWLSFTAKEESGGVQLDWSTVEEINTRYFVIERSVNSNDFTPVDTIAAKGNAVRNDYHYEDGTAPAGQLTYRIKQVDIDSHFTYSKYIMVQIAAQNTRLTLYPNPATNTTRIQLPDGMQQGIVQIYTQSGSQVRSITASNLQLIDCSGLPKGIYYIVVKEKQKIYTERLIIL
ncbi:MAG: T9SS type A sorting domain-containing protein, partial [Chitinophaga rupis]